MDNKKFREVSIPNIRWIVSLKNGKKLVENHDHGRTWRTVYKDNFGNIEKLYFQIIPEGIIYEIQESPFGEYWTFEDMEVKFGGGTQHISRNIASLQEVNPLDKNDTKWLIVTVDYNKKVSKRVLSGKDIGYNTL